jgi:hypothetical protein
LRLFLDSRKFLLVGPLLTLLTFTVMVLGFLVLNHDEEPEREWSDSTGGYKIVARIVDADDTSVTLKKTDGSVVTVPLDRLSSESKAFAVDFLIKKRMVESRPPVDAENQEIDASNAKEGSESEETISSSRILDPQSLNDFAAVKKVEQQLLYAAKIFEAYERLLKNPDLDGLNKEQSQRRMQEVAPFVKSNAVYVKGQFLTASEISQNDEKAERLIAESFEHARKGDEKKWIRSLNDAANVNPVSPHANFIMGLGQAIELRNYDTAARQFKQAIERADTFEPLLNNAGPKIKNAALNNIAIATFRNNETSLSCRYWRQIENADNSEQAAYRRNILHAAVYLHAAERKTINYLTYPSKAGLKGYQEVLDSFSISKQEIASHREQGWLYVGYTPHREGITPLDETVIKLKDVACLHCQGRNFVPCGRCVNGTVGKSKIEIVELPGDRRTTREVKWTEPCVPCNGSGVVECKICIKGVEVLPK